MTTDTETLRERFELAFQVFDLSRNVNGAGDYADRVVRVAWIAYQAGHAAAKAETAAETAAAVAAERERATDVLAAFIPQWDGQEVVDGGDLIRMLIGAIRAGAKERGE